MISTARFPTLISMHAHDMEWRGLASRTSEYGLAKGSSGGSFTKPGSWRLEWNKDLTDLILDWKSARWVRLVTMKHSQYDERRWELCQHRTGAMPHHVLFSTASFPSTSVGEQLTQSNSRIPPKGWDFRPLWLPRASVLVREEVVRSDPGVRVLRSGSSIILVLFLYLIPHSALTFFINLFPTSHFSSSSIYSLFIVRVHVCRSNIGSLQYLNSLLPPLFLSCLKLLQPTSISGPLLFLPAPLYFFPGLLVSVLPLVWSAGVSLMSFSADVVLGWSRRLPKCLFFLSLSVFGLQIMTLYMPLPADFVLCQCHPLQAVLLCRNVGSFKSSSVFSLHIMTLYLPLSAHVVVCWGRRLLMPLSADFVLCRCHPLLGAVLSVIPSSAGAVLCLVPSLADFVVCWCRCLLISSSAGAVVLCRCSPPRKWLFFCFYLINECILSTDYDTI
jgi:hypothetical protein